MDALFSRSLQYLSHDPQLVCHQAIVVYVRVCEQHMCTSVCVCGVCVCVCVCARVCVCVCEHVDFRLPMCCTV